MSADDVSLVERVHSNPPNWKDWVGFAGMVVTVALVFVQGGRILESLDNTRIQLNQVVGVVTVLKDEMAGIKNDITRQIGVNALHAEQIKGLNDKVNGIERNVGNRPR